MLRFHIYSTIKTDIAMNRFVLVLVLVLGWLSMLFLQCAFFEYEDDNFFFDSRTSLCSFSSSIEYPIMISQFEFFDDEHEDEDDNLFSVSSSSSGGVLQDRLLS